MPLHDTSNIPDEPEYWSSLADRVVAAVRLQRPSMLGWMSSRGVWIAAASLVLAVLLGWGAERGRATTVGTTVPSMPDPPSVGSLLFSTSR